MRKISLAFLFISVLSVTSCNSGQVLKTQSEPASSQNSGNSDSHLQTGITAKNKSSDKPIPMICKNARLRIQVKNANESRRKIDSLTVINQAWLSKENLIRSAYSEETEITLRVPVNEFDKLMNSLSSIASIIDNKEINTEEVGAQYVNLGAKINSLKKLEERYLDLLNRTAKIDELLSIQEKAGELQTEIDMLESQLNQMSDKITYSTIILSYYVPTIMSEEGYFSRLARSVQIGWDIVQELSISFVTIWPLLLAGGIFFMIIKRKNKIKQNLI